MQDAPRQFDAIVIGSGPGGEGAAMKLSKEGKTVALVERYQKVGGGCTHWGTIPSKALRHAVHRMQMMTSDPLFSGFVDRAKISFPQLLLSASGVIGKQANLRRGFYDRNDVEVVTGDASFLDDHTVIVHTPIGTLDTLRADTIVIAVGSRPARPDGIDFNHPRIFDSDTILKLDHTPKTMIVYGAGVIGCEYTSIFRRLAVKVNLINTREKLLAFLDDEIIDALAYHLRDQGVLIRNDERCERVETTPDGVVVHLASGKSIRADVLLWAQGRQGNVEGLNLDGAGVDYDLERGRIVVDSRYRTNQAHIYAVGDVIGPPALASAAYDQGRYAASHICHADCDERLGHDIPTGIYTSPEISSIGRTERELTEAKIPYEVGHAFFRHLARAQITGQTVGMLKMLFHRHTLEVLGIHCFGQNAAEIIHIGQAIMAQPAPHNTMNYFVNTTFNYPTMAEAYRVAALNGLNRLF